jgi:uncharacterized membrane protein YgcG
MLLGVGAAFVLIQVLPFGREHANPPVRAVAPWPDGPTRTLVTRSCFDCHSNESHWAWYTFVAPVSWAVQRDVYRAREKLNFTDWERSQQIEKAPQKVRSGEMPLFQYLLAHPEARLSDAERETLARGLEALAGSEGRGGDGDGGGRGRGGPGGSGGSGGSGSGGRSGRD